MPNSLFQNFYENLKLSFNSKREKNSLGKIFEDIEDQNKFTCQNIYEMNKEYLIQLQNYTQDISLLNITNHLVQVCENSKITESKDFRTIFERHFQYIKNEIMNVNEIIFPELIDHMSNDEKPGKISLFFNFVIIYIVEISYYIPYQNAIKKLKSTLNMLVNISELIFLLCDILTILLVALFFIPGINNLCNQIFTLKKVFKIFEIHE